MALLVWRAVACCGAIVASCGTVVASCVVLWRVVASRGDLRRCCDELNVVLWRVVALLWAVASCAARRRDISGAAD